jgi:hypothetical protein
VKTLAVFNTSILECPPQEGLKKVMGVVLSEVLLEGEALEKVGLIVW